MRSSVVCGGLATLMSYAGAVSADPDPIAIDPVVDVPLTVSTALLGGSLHFMREELVRDPCAPSCDEGAVNAIDAVTVGRYVPTVNPAANLLLGVNVTFPVGVGLAAAIGSDADDAWGAFGEDMMLVAEVLAISVALHQVTTVATQRPRPYAYSSRLEPDRYDSAFTYHSFYSGHAANAFAAATTTSYLFTLRHPDSPWTPAVWVTSHGLASLQGYLRIASGSHFISDVVVAAAVGSATGLAVVAAHELRNEAGVMVSPMAMPGGLGLGIVTRQ